MAQSNRTLPAAPSHSIDGPSTREDRRAVARLSDELSDVLSAAKALALTCHVLGGGCKPASETLRVGVVPRINQSTDEILDLAFVAHRFSTLHSGTCV
jgi:hypothetical protein